MLSSPISRELRWLALFNRWKPLLFVVLAVLLAGLLFVALRDLIADLQYQDIVMAVQDTQPWQLLLALLATVVSYVALTGYDSSAMRYLGVQIPYRVVAQTSFIAYALSNTVGLGVLTGGAVRMRMYGAAGLEAGLISRAIAFNAVAFGLGISIVAAVALLWQAEAVAAVAHTPAWLIRALAACLLAIGATILVLGRNGREHRVLGRLRFRPPAPALALRQLCFSTLDIAANAAVIWVLLPPDSVPYTTFLAFFSIAVVAGVISHLPGGLGVFEAVMLLALGGEVPTEVLAGALLLNRLIYYVLPLLLALGLLLVHEVRHGRRASPVAKAVAGLAPRFLAAYTLVVAVMLLVSGATPATDQATELLALHIPLALVEASHFLGSLAGIALLFVARGMVLRLDAAWWAGLLLAITSMVLAIPKGVAFTELVLISALVLALALSRPYFNRRASLLAQPFTGGWTIAIVVILCSVIGLFFLVHQQVDYVHQLWWQFEFDSHAPRSLRAMGAVALVALVLALRYLFTLSPAPWQPPNAAQLQRVAQIVDRQDSADAVLALMGDKHFMFADTGDAFLMFGRQGRSWISLFDPVGPWDHRASLIWGFIDSARQAGGRASFYQVCPQSLPLYLDAGLRIYKLGEYASVPLAAFSLQGKQRAKLRQALNRAQREGLTMEVIAAESVPSVIDEMRVISDAWLAEHSTAEKGFSLGAFDEAYIRRQAVALVRREGRVIAFGTLMTTAQKVEASIDLMRQLPEAPPATMDFLFIQLMLHFQAQGYRSFGLGMAPLSGMAEHPLAPRWHRMGRLLFAHGEHFYNFQGLRVFKSKFYPDWEPRYLACAGGVVPLLVLADTAALIGGSFKGVVGK